MFFKGLFEQVGDGKLGGFGLGANTEKTCSNFVRALTLFCPGGHIVPPCGVFAYIRANRSPLKKPDFYALEYGKSPSDMTYPKIIGTLNLSTPRFIGRGEQCAPPPMPWFLDMLK